MGVEDTPLLVAVEQLQAQSSTFAFETSDAATLATLLSVVRDAQAALDSLVVRMGMRADALAAEGRSAPAAELLLDGGRVRGATARAEAARAAAAKRIPGLESMVADGRLDADRLDALADQTRRLPEADLQRLDITQVLSDAARLPADTFAAAVKRSVDELMPDGRRTSAEEKRSGE